jgi:CubicO group peptidase (beta-lactamase class C family)
MWRRAAAALLAALIASPAAAQPALPETVDAFDVAFRVWHEKHRSGPAVLAISYQGRLVLARGYGGAHADSRMHIGSLSKAITAACVATLIQAGKFDFDSRLEQVLAGYFRDYGEPRDARIRAITIEQLLTHRGGFGTPTTRDPFTRALDEQLKYKQRTAVTMIETLRGVFRIELGSAPGEIYRYANAGYHTLGTIIEMVSGQSYARYCADSVLAPVGIRGAALSVTNYLRGASGGWVLSGPEYLAFYRLFEPDNETVLAAATKRWMFAGEGKWTDEQRTVFYSLGVYIRPTREGRFVMAHTGSYTATSNEDTHYAYGSVVTRQDNGMTWFVAHVPRHTAEARRELGSELRRAGQAVRNWPETDLYPQYGLR